MEAKRISLVRQRFFGFPWWNHRGKKVEAPPTFAPHLSHSAVSENFKCRNNFWSFLPQRPPFSAHLIYNCLCTIFPKPDHPGRGVTQIQLLGVLTAVPQAEAFLCQRLGQGQNRDRKALTLILAQLFYLPVRRIFVEEIIIAVLIANEVRRRIVAGSLCASFANNHLTALNHRIQFADEDVGRLVLFNVFCLPGCNSVKNPCEFLRDFLALLGG